MSNFREVNNDILRDWLSFREETIFGKLTEENKNIIFILMKFVKVF